MASRPIRMLSFLVVAVLLAATDPLQAQELRTVAERSDYKSTSRHSEVVEFCEALAKKSPLVRLGELGTSGEGRKLPLVVIADPPVNTPEEATKSGKLVVFAMGNIHAGEVDGKEALLALARDLAVAEDKSLLKVLVVVFAPIFNADGNDKIAPTNRTAQNGPSEVGVRANAAGLDLNRDFVKLESPEVRALVRFFRKWDPAVFIDCHTTNGSRHRYTMTYDGPRHPNAGEERISLVRDKLLPEVGRHIEQATGFKSFFYGNFNRDRTQWTPYEATPRYGIQYVALRQRLGILAESYSYAPYKDRVRASYEFVRGWLDAAAKHKDEIRKLMKAEPDPRLALRTQNVPLGEPRNVLGFEEIEKEGRRVATDKPKDYSLRYVGGVESTLAVTRPFAYVFPASYSAVVENLQRHGVAVDELREDIDLPVEVYRISKVTRAERAYQNHRTVQVEAAARSETRRVPAGTILVRTAQPLGTLAALLLEPQAEDGLTTWNFFDASLKEGTDFPVMRLPAEVPMTFGAIRPLAEDRVLNKRITADMVYGGLGRPPNFSGNPVSVQAWVDDEHFLQNRGGKLMRVEARSGKSLPFHDPAKLAASLKAQPAFNEKTAATISQRTGWNMDPQRIGALIEHEGNTYFAYFDGRPAVKLPKSTGNRELMTFSPDSKWIAFHRNANLYVIDLETQTEKALTTDGGGEILNGKADWVYEEEVFDRRGKPFWWSPDSKAIAFMRFDDTPVPKFTIVNQIPTRLKVERESYPKAGDPNPLVKLGVVAVAGGEPRFIDLNGYDPADTLIVRAGWLPDSQSVYLYLMNRVQTWLDVCTAGAAGSPMKKLFRDTTPAWVDEPGEPTFLKDGSFLFASARTGWRHLYHYDVAGKLIRPITEGDWEARKLHAVDEAGGWVYLSGTRDSHIAQNLYRVRLDGTRLERLTGLSGSHIVSLSPKAQLFVDTYSSMTTPTRLELRAADGGLLRVLDTNPIYSREEYRLAKTDQVQIKMPDGFLLEGTVTRPLDFDESKKHPVWFKTYAGPHAPTVSDSWAGGRLDDQALASLDIVVFRTDPRSASGKGACSVWTAYKQLGVGELKDIEAAIDWLCAQPGIDAKRVGMSGHSYGGFMTAFALTHSKKFAAGIAGAPVTDWRLYDTIYTERYMHLPNENKAGYDATSVVKAAKNLHGRLLLLHGMMDDNVHVQNTVQFINELQRANKDFEIMVYPTARHGIGGRHYQRQILSFICRSLGVAEKN